MNTGIPTLRRDTKLEERGRGRWEKLARNHDVVRTEYTLDLSTIMMPRDREDDAAAVPMQFYKVNSEFPTAKKLSSIVL